MSMKLLLVAGARPNFVKVAPLLWEIRRWPEIQPFLVHTGQHYDQRLSDVFFDELEIPACDCNLGVGSASHAEQTAEVMRRIEPVLLQQQPDAVCVVGDVNSTLAASLTAAKLGIPVAHVEAGLRSFDRRMPEEVNRVLTDAISDWLFASEENAVSNLMREGVSETRIHLVGNVMIDTLVACLPRIDMSPVLTTLSLKPGEFGTVTLHRPATVDDEQVLQAVMGALNDIAADLPLVFPVHPRTRAKLNSLYGPRSNIRLVEPLGYLDFLKLVKESRLVLTDSGGLQEETTFLRIPCLTLRENTERPVTLQLGTNRLVGLDPRVIVSAARAVLNDAPRQSGNPAFWDGKTASRVISVLVEGRIVDQNPHEQQSNR
jgi:UDP-N-acetylglucosamine 2-epimerase (non-hydrolysing)